MTAGKIFRGTAPSKDEIMGHVPNTIQRPEARPPSLNGILFLLSIEMEGTLKVSVTSSVYGEQGTRNRCEVLCTGPSPYWNCRRCKGVMDHG